MEKFSKKTLLNYVNGAGLFGAAAGQVVSFKFADTIAKAITAAATSSNGSLIFAIDSATGAGAIWQDNHLVSSKVIDYSIADSASKDHGQKTVTLKYIGASGVEDKTFNIIDEAGLKAYFANSKTITLDTSTYEVKIKNDGGLKVDNTNGLYVDIADLFGVDASTIGFNAQKKLKTLLQLQYHAAVTEVGEEKAAYIALEDVNGNSISEIPVSNIIGNGILKSVTYNKDNNTLILVFEQADGTERTITVDMKDLIDINDIFLDTAHDADDYLTLTNDTSIATFGVTDKTKNGIALAESAIQGVSKGSSTENYVDLTVAAGTDPSTVAISINDTDLNTKISNIDQKDADLDASIDALQAYDLFIDASIDRLDSSVSAIEAAIEGMDATESDNVLDGSIAITVTEANGVITGVNLEATKSTVAYTAKVGETPANLTGTAGLLTGGDIATIKQYIDATQASGFDSLDSNIDIDSADGSLNFKVTEVDGLLTSGEISYTKSTVTFTAAQDNTPSNLTGTEGFVTGGDIAAIKSYVDSVSARLDSSVSDKDTKEFVEVKTEMTDGALSNQEVNVTYGDYTNHTAGVATVEDTSTFVQGLLTWTIL